MDDKYPKIVEKRQKRDTQNRFFRRIKPLENLTNPKSWQFLLKFN